MEGNGLLLWNRLQRELAEKRLHTGQGNLISRAEALKNLGMQTGKDLPMGKEVAE